MLALPADALPAHARALVALFTLSVGDEDGPEPTTYLRTVHVDLSGHAVPAELLKEVLLEGPLRLKQCWQLQGLVLAGCHLTAGGCACMEGTTQCSSLPAACLARLLQSHPPDAHLPCSPACLCRHAAAAAPLEGAALPGWLAPPGAG